MTHPHVRLRARAQLALALALSLSTAALHAQGPATPVLSLTLADAAARARLQGAAVIGATARASQVEARVNQRRADLLPQLSGITEANSRTFNTATLGISFPAAPGSAPFFDPDGEVLGPVPTSDVRARVQQTIFDGAALARLRLARQQGSTARTETSQAGATAATQAAIAYVRVQRADAVLEARAADSTLAADLLRIARETLRAGTGVALDVTRAESQLVSIRSQLIGARVERDKAQLELRRAISVDLNQPIRIADALDAGELEIPQEGVALATAERQRPELQVVNQQLATARLASRAIRAERLPTVNAVADDGFIGKNVGTNMLNTWTWALRVSVPVFEGGRREARESEQSYVQQELEARRSDLLAQVSVDVRSALLDAQSAREAVDAARERVRLSEQELSQARDRFTAGVSGNLDVTSALLGLSGARTQLVDALASRQLARISIARSQGSISSLR
ncbi:MAG: TolC family protein [Gemmatimonadaceae bacterium]|nr:TolC family protein [Gemmatimonadaceae bacterium]